MHDLDVNTHVRDSNHQRQRALIRRHRRGLPLGWSSNPDPAVLAHLLLAPFAPGLFEHLMSEREVTPEEIKAAIDS
ncbi:hypothetical protein GCM10010399_09910 [Dactylosporangium fulvum]|uniref:Uncharacterized protein n=1 Tax=Dactylosporangium fulvum TaxID=53359 RepID=A0ABY5WDZ5_9ACTN|nr:hypothetical protein [Dactylosporangium fulvum]UWP86816.1 hypothetical protein Dfulv_22255 [Dactylosporangium fulvum]